MNTVLLIALLYTSHPININIQTSTMVTVQKKEELKLSDIYKVYDDLKKFSGSPAMIPALEIHNDSEINAWTDGDIIVITTGMLGFLNNKDELAVILSHEMGHDMLDHTKNEMTDDSRLHEAAADKFGVYLMMRAGYNPCVGKEVWFRIAGLGGDNILTDSHPSAIQRAWEFDFPMCRDK